MRIRKEIIGKRSNGNLTCKNIVAEIYKQRHSAWEINSSWDTCECWLVQSWKIRLKTLLGNGNKEKTYQKSQVI